MTGWKYAGFIGAIVGTIGFAIYPIIIRYIQILQNMTIVPLHLLVPTCTLRNGRECPRTSVIRQESSKKTFSLGT